MAVKTYKLIAIDIASISIDAQMVLEIVALSITILKAYSRMLIVDVKNGNYKYRNT